MRIASHPILPIPERRAVPFTWNGAELAGVAGEPISAALVASGIHVFGRHPKDGSPQGIFCANGQCSQCLVIADGRPVKACMTPLQAGMAVESVEGLPRLPADDSPPETAPVPSVETDVLILGGGPAGLSAAIELGRCGVRTLLVDDKDRLGGKLVLQTHKFFGSVADSHAGTRGFEIGRMLAAELARHPSVEVWLDTTAVAVFADRAVGVVRGGRYALVRPRKLLVATGAREKMLPFPGNTLPGVYGAGAFQTLVNRDLVRSSSRVLIVGGGNVGLIAGYHAIQAGIEVAALIEALPEVGGYQVHADKLRRLGVPIHTRHTIVCAAGCDHVESATIAELDPGWRVVPGTEKTLAVDTVLVAVGLAEVNEFTLKAKQFGLEVFSAGDAQEIAEASAAMFTGRIEGLKIARALGATAEEVPPEWDEKARILKSRPGGVVRREPPDMPPGGVYPVFHCFQEVPCNPCTAVCPQQAIRTENDAITGRPAFESDAPCTGCAACVAVCPGLAITLVDGRQDPEHPLVTLPYELRRDPVAVGGSVPLTDAEGAVLGRFPVVKVAARKKHPGTLLVTVRADRAVARRAAGIWVQERPIEPMGLYAKAPPRDEAVICRCERVTAGEIRAAIREGVRDLNQLKALTRAGMGACGSKTCRPMIWRLFQEEGIDAAGVTDRVDRPLFVEVPIGSFAGIEEKQHG
jgi:NADPH-dependent 2,4-dienoyl-CoA reductase/sulfur reductase-like enzyme/Fe-S-cluster-containing hydrogenase component 2/bacterioferritin-associated ferredoxin